MNKSNVVKTFVVISVISFTLHLLNHYSLGVLGLLLNFAENKETRLYLIDPDIISMNIFNGRNTTTIGDGNIITLGMNGTSQTKITLFDHLKDKGFRVFCSEVDTTVNLTLSTHSNKHLPAHFLIYHKHTDFLIHIVVFYKRYRNFIWCDRIQIEDLIQRIKQENLSWLKTEMLEKLHFGRVPFSFNSINTTRGILGNTTLLVPENGDKFLKDYNELEFIECNYTRAEKYYREYKMPREPTDWVLKALEMLEKTGEALDKLGIPFTLGEGTLLGWYRQCGIISHTSDLDILVFREDYSDDIFTSLKKVGFTHKNTFGKASLNDSFEYSFRWSRVKLDLFFVYKEKDLFWIGGTDGDKKLRFTLPKFTNCWSEMLGVRVRVPCDSAAYVEKSYGKNWYKPLKRWFWAKDPSNFKVVGKWDRR
ncbi:hypothetical protein LOTGIDRAFT_227834 [Lottia gigantea]|uniref:Ribitol-5-phosphate transferase FKTN N-terminal domain-containing protein n=1 Tax=Lottia gigantea TaxID=225164 RepID=V4BGV9_LOTGI|nr:hypothetical protein LOTGIDRAFT_227834 [Lottia gigantea]ESP05152.1 hypothetical protein LOTGIDRAFT_227834 [Lottia gigantea]